MCRLIFKSAIMSEMYVRHQKAGAKTNKQKKQKKKTNNITSATEHDGKTKSILRCGMSSSHFCTLFWQFILFLLCEGAFLVLCLRDNSKHAILCRGT